MLPQMMPLPWVFVFFFIFLCFYSFYLYLSVLFTNCASSYSVTMTTKLVILW